jgi:hypothetical protein
MITATSPYGTDISLQNPYGNPTTQAFTLKVTPATVLAIVGTYMGTYQVQNTSHPITVHITTETPAGEFSGTITTIPLGQTHDTTTAFTGHLNPDGTFTAFDPSLQVEATGSFGFLDNTLGFEGSLAHSQGDGFVPFPSPNSIAGQEIGGAD